MNEHSPTSPESFRDPDTGLSSPYSRTSQSQRASRATPATPTLPSPSPLLLSPRWSQGHPLQCDGLLYPFTPPFIKRALWSSSLADREADEGEGGLLQRVPTALRKKEATAVDPSMMQQYRCLFPMAPSCTPFVLSYLLALFIASSACALRANKQFIPLM